MIVKILVACMFAIATMLFFMNASYEYKQYKDYPMAIMNMIVGFALLLAIEHIICA